jgi:hypothetical protein
VTARGTAVYLVLSCDVDPDRPGVVAGTPADRLAWKGMTEGIPSLKAGLRGLTDDAGREPVFTWLLRADEQVREMEGAYAWVPAAHRPFLDSLRQSGDELGWHPHFWRRASPAGRWVQELADEEWQLTMLRRAHAELASSFAGPPRSVRMGWSYHNDRTCAALEELGVAVDCSPLPGYRTLTGGSPAIRENLFDWYATPREPYRPSRADCRRPARDGEASGRLLELPSFVAASLPWALVSGVQMARKRRDARQLWQAIRRPTYCINLTARPGYYAPLVAQLRRSLRAAGSGPLVFSTSFHADEVVQNRTRLYARDSVRANVAALLGACREARAPVEFVPAGRVPALWPA